MTTRDMSPERGWHCEVTLGTSTVTKTARKSFPLRHAQARLRLLEGYAAGLAKEPLPVAPLTSAELIQRNSGLFSVRFTMGLVQGPSVERLQADERLTAVAKIIGHLCGMSQTTRRREPGILRVPVDAHLRNWHVDEETPTLVDIYPPLSRNWHGRIQTYRGRVEEDLAEQAMGRLGSIVPDLIRDATEKSDMSTKDTIEWGMSILPQDDPKLHAFLQQKVASSTGQLSTLL